MLVLFSVSVAVHNWPKIPSGNKDGFHYRLQRITESSNWYQANFRCKSESSYLAELLKVENQIQIEFLLGLITSKSGIYEKAHKFLFGPVPSWSIG